MPARRGRPARSKGIRFERVVAAAFEDAGFTVRGLESGGDHFAVLDSATPIHVETKRHERLRLPEWLAQMERDAPPGWRRVLVFKQSRQPTYVLEPFERWLARERASGGGPA